MKTIVNLVLFLLYAGTLPLMAQSETKEQLTVPLTDPTKPAMLNVSLVNGSIQIVGHTGKDIQIEAVADTGSGKNFPGKDKNKAGKEDEFASGMRRITPTAGLELSAEEKNNRIKIETNSMFRAVDLIIRVPQKCEIEVNNVNGPIELSNVSGSAVANTINGNIKATFREINASAPMAFSTLNGRIDVSFPAAVKATVKLKSDHGDIFSDFDIDIDRSQPQANRSSQSGMYRVTVESWVNGKINGGGPEIMIKSMQGNIYLRKGAAK